jgi:hypothetical protein
MDWQMVQLKDWQMDWQKVMHWVQQREKHLERHLG